jgi:thiol-disulfide isomerase/thioredoxin
MTKYIIICLAIISATSRLQAQTKYAIISGKLDFLKEGDSVKFDVYKYGFLTNVDFQDSYYAKIHDHHFTARIPVTHNPQYMAIDFFIREKNLNSMVIEPGDNIFIKEENGQYFFTGVNSTKYNVTERLKNIYHKWHPRLNYLDPDLFRQILENDDSTTFRQLTVLDSCKSQLSVTVYSLMRDNIISHVLFKGSLVVRTVFPHEEAKAFIAAYATCKANEFLNNEIKKLPGDSANVIYTQFYLGGIINQYRRDSCFMLGKSFDVMNCYNYLKRNFFGSVKEALVTWLIFDWKNTSPDLQSMITDALTYVKNDDFRNVLLKIESSKIKGAAAYNFQLTDQKGRKISFDQFRGKSVLLDFWYTGCQSCVETAPYLAKIEKQFENSPVVFISICVDKDKSRWKKSLFLGLYTSRYILNLYTNGGGAKDPVISHYNINSYPGLILIDKNGRLGDVVGDPREDNGVRLRSLISKIL